MYTCLIYRVPHTTWFMHT